MGPDPDPDTNTDPDPDPHPDPLHWSLLTVQHNKSSRQVSPLNSVN